MRLRNLLMLGTILLAAPARGEAQRRPPAEAPARQRPGPVEILLRNRAVLGLNAEQEVRLEAIRLEMEELNRPLVGRMVEIRREMRPWLSRHERTAEERERYMRRLAEARPLMERIRENNRAAMRRVGEVLTREQKAKVREMVKGERSRRGPRGRPRG